MEHGDEVFSTHNTRKMQKDEAQICYIEAYGVPTIVRMPHPNRKNYSELEYKRRKTKKHP